MLLNQPYLQSVGATLKCKSISHRPLKSKSICLFSSLTPDAVGDDVNFGEARLSTPY
jgi:hypothetical protein